MRWQAVGGIFATMIFLAADGWVPARGEVMSSYDIRALLKFDGPSMRRQTMADSWVTILDYRNTDANEGTASILLSSQGIPHHIERPQGGWSQSTIRMFITVPAENVKDAEAVLAAAAEQLRLERVEGMKGLAGFQGDE